MAIPRLESWELLPDGRYKGCVHGRRGFEDGTAITTGAVTKKVGTTITTGSGSTYRLGRKAPGASEPKPPPPAPRQVEKKENKPPVARNNRRAGHDLDEWGGRGLGEALARPKPAAASYANKPRDSYANKQQHGGGGGGGGGGGNSKKKGLEATLLEHKKEVHVGDRVRVKGLGHGTLGEVMFVGAAAFASGRQMCGVKLDRPLAGSVADGKEKGERYFRCKPGHGHYVLLSDVEVVPAKDHHRPSHEDASAPFDLDACLTALVGLTAAKSELRSMRNRLEVGRKREVFGVKDRKPPHLFLVGSLGMNFRSFADAVAGMLSDLQVLRTSNVVEVSKEDLVASGSEATAKLAMAAAEKALGGVLLVRDASSLVSSGEGGNSNDRQSEFYGQMAVTSLLKVVGDAHAAGKAPPLVLVFCVRREGEQALLRAAPALATLVPTKIELAEYSLPETALLVRRTVEAQNFKLSAALDDDALVEILKPHLGRCPADKRGEVLAKTLVEAAVNRQTDRVFGSKTVSKASLLSLTSADFEEAPAEQGVPAEQVLKRLDGVVGLAGVKTHIRSLIAQLDLEKQRRQAGLPSSSSGSSSLHMIFQGNPGTGKTTVARIVSEVFQSLGLLRSGHCVEADRASLVAGYVGQTALKVNEVVSRALGGVLFVDEAYALVKDDKDAFGREALDTLIKLVEDHRDDLVVVLAGYTAEMGELLARNPGVRSRFPTVIEFVDYSADELMEIARILLVKQQLVLDDGAEAALRARCDAIAGTGGPQNGNGRAVRNIIEGATRAQALRLVGPDQHDKVTTEQMCRLTAGDFENAPAM